MTCRSGCEKTELEDQIASLEAGIEHRDAENAALRERLERHRQVSECWNCRMAEEWQRAETLQGQAEQYKGVLTELIVLKDKVKHDDPADYERRKPGAWEAARRVLHPPMSLSTPAPPDTDTP